MKKTILNLVLILLLFNLNGCYNEIIEAVDNYAIQAPFNYTSTGNKIDVTIGDKIDTIFYTAQKLFTYTDGDKIYDLPEYKNNIDKVKNIEIFQITAWLDYISDFDQADTLENFETIQTFIKFQNSESIRIHYQENVKISELYKNSLKFKPVINELDYNNSQLISERLLKQERFQFYSYFTRYTGNRKIIDTVDFNISASLRLTLDTEGDSKDHSHD